MANKLFKVHLLKEIVTSNSPEAFLLHDKSGFGEPVNDNEKIQYSLSEAMYLVEKGKIEVIQKNKKVPKKDLIKKFQRIDKKFQIKYLAYKDLRTKGYIVKTALKFGADFRVYPKGSRPGKGHAKWIVFVEHESKRFTWHEFSAKNRVAHSTKKNLLIAIVDEESDITYYEVSWIKP
ncbi:tRNA-intron lyase [Candidatus Woesearchaeota archaeon]|nr:tRNA-intron lyase [Candidatus Woesearchaeota archaeon]